MFSTVFNIITTEVPPRAAGLLWNPTLIHLITNSLIAISYFAISVALLRWINLKKNITYYWTITLFAAFIMACGINHAMMVWNIWHGHNGVEAVFKIITAIASVASAIIFWPTVHRLIASPNSGDRYRSGCDVCEINDLNISLAETIKQLKVETAEKELVQAELLQSQKMDAVGKLTSGIAHDFNNLLMVISGNLELIKLNPQSEKYQLWLDNSAESVERASKLTAALLTFSRVQKLEMREINVGKLLTNITEILERTLGNVSVKFTPSSDRIIIDADLVQLELAMLNIAINAKNAMPNGGNFLIEMKRVGKCVEIWLQDDGHGISPEFQSRVFEPFFTTKDIGKGAGLGLSIVYGIIEQLEGRVRIESSDENGTIFVIALPLKELDDE